MLNVIIEYKKTIKHEVFVTSTRFKSMVENTLKQKVLQFNILTAVDLLPAIICKMVDKS